MRRAKITVPLRPPGFVERPSVRAALEAQSVPRERGRVVLVSAPAGYGKTAAVTDWVRADPDVAAAWVGLDAGDRDERRWWTSVLAALTVCPAVAEDSPLHRVAPSWSDDSARVETVSAILEALEAMTVRVRLVLDDLQTIADHGALTGLQELLRHPLPMLTIVLCSRYDPPVGIDRLRLDDRFGEVRADQLAFTEPQAAELFRREGLDLDDDQTATLVARTEGWVAALRLASLSLHRRDDPAAFVREFAGDDRSVADYLVGEVLAHLGEREHAVLAAATVTSPMHLDLAVALTGHDDAGDVLDGLATSTAMVTATDRRREYYRVHELLRSHTLARLRRGQPEHLRGLYRRAAEWHDARGDHVEALRCAGLAGDVEATELLVRTRAVELLGRGEFTALARSEQLIGAAADPRVGLLLGLAALENGDLGRADELVAAAAAGAPGDECDDVAVLRRAVTIRASLARGRPDDVGAAARAIRPEVVEGAPLRALALMARASGLVDGEPDQARRDATEALALAERHDWPYLAVQAQSTLGLARSLGGDRSGSRAHARAAIVRATSHGWSLSPGHLRARVLMATDEILGGRPEAALTHLHAAEDARDRAHPDVASALGTLRAAADHDTGLPLAGWQGMRHARMAAVDLALPIPQVALAAVLEQHAALGLGRAREAGEVTRAVAPRLVGSAEAALLHARLLWVTARDPGARRLLAPVFARRLRLLTSLGIVEPLLVDAEIAATLEEHAHVHEQLRRALRLAARFDLLRPLRALAEPLRAHLAAHQGAFGALDPLVDDVLAHRPDDLEAVRDPLTDRERAVLAFLPSQRSSVEIAQDLAVSLNTIKTHQRAIYHKLGVGSRREAVARARQIGLIDAPRTT
ncbi:LuxR C-terminal-related transcriptional regulator [Actinomycetospora sp. NBC_00405]|uniref:LuxR C-terminal-related transcriptional regulator n=1 Tax=Actinomycetospora sp. NBC_00405 TaxID=2975952 RepID=UPI002E1B97BD